METIYYAQPFIRVNTSNKGFYIKLVIEQVWKAEEKQREDWTKTIIEFGQCFDTEDEAKNFQKTKMFKQILKAVEKNIINF